MSQSRASSKSTILSIGLFLIPISLTSFSLSFSFPLVWFFSGGQKSWIIVPVLVFCLLVARQIYEQT